MIFYVDLMKPTLCCYHYHTALIRQNSSWLFISGCQWLLCSLLPSNNCILPLLKNIMYDLNDRAQNPSRWMDLGGTVGWHLLALSHLPRYQAGVEQNLSQKPWRGCSVENRRWNPTAKRQLAGECCYEGGSTLVTIEFREARQSRLDFNLSYLKKFIE